MKAKIRIIPCAEGLENIEFRIMLETMYRQWAKNSGHIIGEIDDGLTVEGDISGIEQEHGIHRLVRISPHDPKARRHTTYCKVLIGELPDPQWTGNIRSYTFHPYKRVKNYGTGKEVANIEAVLSGYPNLLWT